MNPVRHRLSLLALGILAPVLAFGAIALSGAPSAAAIDEEPYVSDSLTDCELESWKTSCGSMTYCSTYTRYDCDEGSYETVYTYSYDDVNQAAPGCYIGLNDFNYCP